MVDRESALMPCYPSNIVAAILLAITVTGCNKIEFDNQSAVVPSVAPSEKIDPISVVVHSDIFQNNDAVKQVGAWSIDRSAYIGMPKLFAETASAYLERALTLASLNTALQRPTYKRLDLPNGPDYPLGVGWESGVSEPVPILLLPPPEQIRVAMSDLALNDKFKAAKALGRTIFFESGWMSSNPRLLQSLPIGYLFYGAPIVYYPDYLKYGKIVLGAQASDDLEGGALSPLRINKFGGATLLGWLRAILIAADNPVLRAAQLEVPGKPTTEWIAYVIADANGVLRGKHDPANGESAFAKPLQSTLHDPRVEHHSLLRLPMPLSLGQSKPNGGFGKGGPHEEIALDEWFSAADPPIFALTLNPFSNPFRESFILRQIKAGFPIHEPIWLLIVFSNIEPKQLLEALKTLAPPTNAHPEIDSALIEELRKLRDRALTAN